MGDGFVRTLSGTSERTIATGNCKRLLRCCLGLRLRRSLCRRSPKRWLAHGYRLCCGTLRGSDTVGLIGYCLRGGLREVSAIRLQLAGAASVWHYWAMALGGGAFICCSGPDCAAGLRRLERIWLNAP